jgi:hypothetical protein
MEKERLTHRQELQSRMNAYATCYKEIEWNIENVVQKNQFDAAAQIPFITPFTSSEFIRKIEEYVENYQKCQDWFQACKETIELVLSKMTKSMLPKTLEKCDLIGFIGRDECIHRFVNGERVTKHWIEENFPNQFAEIIRNLQETETQLDLFFRELNIYLENNKILTRFRQEKKELIEYGTELMKELGNELQLLSERIKKI